MKYPWKSSPEQEGKPLLSDARFNEPEATAYGLLQCLLKPVEEAMLRLPQALHALREAVSGCRCEMQVSYLADRLH